MKTIIKPRFAAFRADCWFCGCRFEYEANDIEPDDDDVVVCPCCGRGCEHTSDNGEKRYGE